MIWPRPYKAPNFKEWQTLLPPKPITSQTFKKPQVPLQQGDWSNLTSEPVAPFGLSPIVQGSKPILPPKQLVETPNITQQVQAQMPKPAVMSEPAVSLPQQEQVATPAPQKLPETGVIWYKPMLDKQEYLRIWTEDEKKSFRRVLDLWADPDKALEAYMMLVDKRVQWEEQARREWWTKWLAAAQPQSWLMWTLNKFNPIWWAFEKIDELAQNIPVVKPEAFQSVWNQVAQGYWDILAWKEKYSNKANKAAYNWVSKNLPYWKEIAEWLTRLWEWETVWPISQVNPWATIANMPWSAVKTATATARAITNPLDTLVWLKNLVATPEWKKAILDRYWSRENLWKTIQSDPSWVASDILTIIQWWANIASKWASMLGKTWAATRFSEISRISWWAANMWVDIPLNKWISVVEKIPYVGKWLVAPLKPLDTAIELWWAVVNKVAKAVQTKPWEVGFSDRAISAVNWMDSQSIRKFKDNPDLIKQIDEWKVTADTIKEDLSSIVEWANQDKRWVGSNYQTLYENPTRFNVEDVKNSVVQSLSDQWVKFKDWKISWFDTTKMTWLSDQAKTALKSKFDDIISTLEWKQDLSVEELHNIRKDIYATSYADWFNTKKAPWVQKVADVLSSKLETIPWFKEVDAWFKEAADLATEIRNNVLNKQWDFKWTLKSLLWERWNARLQALEKFYPWLRDKIETLAAYDDYIRTRDTKKVGLYEKAWTAITAWAAWMMTGWPILWLITWIAWPILSDFVRDPKWFKNYIVWKAGKDIASKIDAGKTLSKAEQVKLNLEIENLKANPKLALEYKPNVVQPKTPITPEWVVKEKTVIPPKQQPKTKPIIAERWTAVSPSEKARYADIQAKNAEIQAKKQQQIKVQQEAQAIQEKAIVKQKQLESDTKLQKLTPFEPLGSQRIKDWEYVTKYWVIQDTVRWAWWTKLDYVIDWKKYPASEVDVFKKKK